MNICFTGHRPNKLGGYSFNTSKNKKIMYELKDVVLSVINTALKENKDESFKFIFGGALGIDQMAFQICNEIKRELFGETSIFLEIAIPFEAQPTAWKSSNDIRRYYEQLNSADYLTYVDTLDSYKYDKVDIGEYHPAKMQIRNKYMVDNSDLVIGVWDGSTGGTKNCLDYAKKINKKRIIINPAEY